MERSRTALGVGALLMALGLSAVPARAVCPSIVVGPVELPGGVEDDAYPQSLSQTGADLPEFTVTSGALPTGLTLVDNTGAFTGTLDAAGTFVFTATVTETDTDPAEAEGCTGGRSYRIVVTNVNDAPTDIALSNSSVNENQPVGTAVGNFSTTDPDAGDTHTYTLVAGAGDTDNASFQIVGNELRTNAVFNFEAKSSYSIRVRSTDSGALFFEEAFTITIVDVPEPPVADDDPFDHIGNTELRVDLGAGATPAALETTPSTFGVLDGDVDPDIGDTLSVSGIVGCADASAPFGDSPLCATVNGGNVVMEANGRFSFVPKNGDLAASDSFQYTVRDSTALTDTGLVTLTRFQRVWYVRNNSGAGLGRSTDPFNTLVGAQNASLAKDWIFVYFGDGGTTGQNAGIALKNGQHLIGQFAGLSIPVNLNGNGSPTVLVAVPGATDCNGGPCRPLLDDTVVGAPEGVGATDVIPEEIVRLNLAGNVNAIDWTTTGAVTGTLRIRDNVVRSAGVEGVDVNLGGTGATNLTFHDNNLTATGTALDIQESGTGALTITAFHDLVVTGNSAAAGLNVNTPLFDAIPGGGVDAVPGGTTVIGEPGNRIGGPG